MTSQAATCATSLLAEHFDAKSPKRFSSGEIAKERKLSQAIVAKVLTIVSQAGIVTGAPGPGGGYWLARAPAEITLLEVVAPFERLEPSVACPYGEGWCGTGPQRPLHNQLLKFQTDASYFLSSTTLNSFRVAVRKKEYRTYANGPVAPTLTNILHESYATAVCLSPHSSSLACTQR